MSKEYEIAMVVACANGLAIGRDNRLPWSIPAEMRHFIELTKDRVVLAGANTATSIGKALKGRTCVTVATRGVSKFVEDGWIVFPTLDEALAGAAACASRRQPERLKGWPPKIFVIGGERLYRELLPHADYIHLSTIHMTVWDADAFFPKMDESLYYHRPRGWTNPVYSETREMVTPGWQYDFYINKGSYAAQLAHGQINGLDTIGDEPMSAEDSAKLNQALEGIFHA